MGQKNIINTEKFTEDLARYLLGKRFEDCKTFNTMSINQILSGGNTNDVAGYRLSYETVDNARLNIKIAPLVTRKLETLVSVEITRQMGNQNSIYRPISSSSLIMTQYIFPSTEMDHVKDKADTVKELIHDWGG